ncbi:helix-turn-helix transcriptional regulator [Fuerstiella marisgermanici]|uniref:Helix-turn-helix domain-containing protein n=1 Tax=Fuerstiella marisgermanici TaxID=1891926 RepID=A0A1P8WGW8_9PLAN|nr:helix-turn-helix domain-containing protein [Fuerstiella marisgermanici]APZ93275.1 hypothetical protein Fuma_02892 [Fuerstiella marisgermanici]
MNSVDDLQQRIREAIDNVEPGSRLDEVLQRWGNYRPTVRIGDRHLIQGYIDMFRSCHEISCAVDPTIDSRLPSHCCDPESIASFFRIPLEELAPDYVQESSTTENTGPEKDIERIATAIERLTEHLAPEPADIVGTPYLAQKLGCSSAWITQQIRDGQIPQACIVDGTGNGKPWKFHRHKIDRWIRDR